MHLVGLLLVTVLSFVVGQNVYVPTTNCVWRNASYGHTNTCEGNEVVIGSCGSGHNPDCDKQQGYYHQLLCCDMYDYYVYSACQDFGGTYGQHLSCNALNDGSLVEAACGSGRLADCNGQYHTISCCVGQFGSDGTRLISGGYCYWKYGSFGEKVTCNANDEAVFGRCGSGNFGDCAVNGWHGIECCKLDRVLMR